MSPVAKKILKVFLLSCLALAIALVAAGSAFAQGNDVKPIRLVTGEVVPDRVRPTEVKVAPGAEFEGKYFKLIQFARIPSDLERQQWARAGLRLADYLPDDTYFAVIDQGFDLGRLTGKAVTIIDVADVFRLEPRLAALRAEGQPVDKLVVSYYATLDAARVIAVLQARGVTIKAHRDYSHQLDIVIDPARLEEIVALPYLQFLGQPPEEPVLEPYDHRNATGRSNYLNTGYNGLNYNGAGVVVGIGEGGTVDNLVDVKGRLTEMVSGSPSSHKIGVTQNAGGAGNLDPTNRNNAWGATFLSIDNPNYAALYTSHSLRYTNHSYGVSISGGYDQTARDHDLRIAAYPNHLVIYSSGNSGDVQGYAPYNFAGCPADLTQCWANITGQMKQNKNMFAVGALDPDDVLTGFSSRGPMYDGRIIPQVVIEGIEGTSDAAPKVTGELAILAQAYKAKNSGTEPPSSLLRAIMMNTADDLGNAGPDHKHGYGRPNLRRAYTVIDNARFLTSSVSNGGMNSHTITVPANTKQVRVMVVWPDAAAAVNAAPAIVNNLNLVVKDPSNTPYNPWVLDHTANPANLDATATRQVDNLNTIEQVTVDDPPTGTWTIEVNGANVPSGPQTYYVTYEFLGDELTMMFPLKDHRFVSDAAYQLKWDSYGASGTFTLAYQLDGGSWVNIASGISASARTYAWTAPAVTGIRTIKFRVQRGALTSESDVNYIGQTPAAFYLHWACADALRLAWNAVPDATSYKVYRLGTQYMEEVSSNITFDGASAILTGQSTGVEYYAVSALTGSNEGQRTMALTKSAGDTDCFNVKTGVTRSVDKTDVTVRGSVNPHNATLTNVHFEYGPTTSYGSTTPNIPISAVGHVEETVSSAIAAALSSRSDVLHYRLVATKDGATTVYGEDREIRLAPGSDFTFDGVDDFIDVSDHLALPIYRSGTGTGYAITFWVKSSPQNAKEIYSEASSTDGDPWLTIRTATSGQQLWIIIRDDNGSYLRNAYSSGNILDDTWHHVAFVDANGSAKLYIDGNQDQAFTYTPGPMTLNRASIGARLTSSASNFFTGRVDEVNVWDKALTAAEVRDLLHQPRQGDEAGLKAYYHLDDMSSRVFDVVSEREATIGGGGTKTTSAAPFGVGATFTAPEAAGSVTFTGTGLTAYYNSQAGGTVTGSRIDLPPNTVSGVSGSAIFDSQYWVIHRYGTGSFNANLTFTVSEALTAQDEAQPFRIKLYSRAQGSDGAWSLETYASNVNATTKQVTFYGMTVFNKQYIIARLDDGKSWDGSESTDWFDPNNWTPAGVPTATDDVLIASTAPNQPAINAAGAVCRNISIESGATLTMSGATAYTLSVYGDWINNGTFNRGIGTVSFDGTNSYQEITGSSTSNFYVLKVQKGNVDRVLEAAAPITLNATTPDARLELVSGTFKLSNSASDITVINANGTATANALGSGKRVWVTAGTLRVNSSWRLNAGELKITGGAVHVGDADSEYLDYLNNGKLIVQGGQLNLAAAFYGNAPNSSCTIQITDGVITVPVYWSAVVKPAFEVTPNCSFSMNGGTIAIRTYLHGSIGHEYANLTSNATVTGGTLQIGNAATPTGQTIRINSVAPVYNLVVNATNSPTAQLVTNPLTVKNDVTISGGTLNANNLDINVGGNWTNNGGTFTPGSGTVVFNGAAAQTIGGTAGATFNNLTINNSGSGVSLGQNQTVNRLLTLTNGDVNLGGYTLTLATATAGNGVTATGARAITGSGTVAITAYRAISGGTLAFGPNATVRLTNGVDFGAGGLSTVNGVLLINGGGYVQAGRAPTYGNTSTLKYDTSGPYGASEEWYPNTTSGPGVPQNVEIASGTTLNFGSSGSARTARGDMTINGTLALSTNIGGDLNLAGDWVNNGTFNHNSRAVTFNGSGAQTIGGSADTTFAYLTINNTSADSAGVSLGRNTAVNNLLTLTDGLLKVAAYNLTLGTGASITHPGSTVSMVVTDVDGAATGDGFLCKGYGGNGSFAFPVGDAYGTTEYSPSTLNFTADLASSTVCARVTNARHPNWPGTNYPTYITRYWTATSSDNTFTCTASFTYVDGDVVLGGTPQQTEAALYHKVWDGASWTTRNQTDVDTNTLSSVVNSFSDHSAFSGSPLAVTLAAFDAQATADGVMLAWETVSELDNAGFNVYRTGSDTGPWSKLNDALIPAATPGAGTGQAYTWEDVSAQPNTAYLYRLEAVDLTGNAEILGITGVTYRPAQRRWLPLVR